MHTHVGNSFVGLSARTQIQSSSHSESSWAGFEVVQAFGLQALQVSNACWQVIGKGFIFVTQKNGDWGQDPRAAIAVTAAHGEAFELD